MIKALNNLFKAFFVSLKTCGIVLFKLKHKYTSKHKKT